ncbi:MAG: hypothetical protein ACSHYA_19755 [Opitutaceae bacterium]
MKLFSTVLFLICASTSHLVAEAEYRTFESSDGATIEATVIEASATSVTIQRRDGREFKDVPLERFSAKDRRYVREWRKAQEKAILDANLQFDSRVKVTVQKGEDDDKNDYGDIDDRVVQFEPGIVADNDEKELTFRNVKGTLVMIGRGVIERDSYVILNKQDFTIDFIPRERTRWQGNRFQCRYDPDYGGFEYAGYLVVLRDKQGNPAIIKGSKSI